MDPLGHIVVFGKSLIAGFYGNCLIYMVQEKGMRVQCKLQLHVQESRRCDHFQQMLSRER